MNQADRMPQTNEWFHVERSRSDQLDSYVTESTVAFAGGWIEIRQYSWHGSKGNVWSTGDCYFFNMSLDRSVIGQVSNLTNQAVKSEPLSSTFMVPPHQTMESRSTDRGQMRSMRCALSADVVERFMERTLNWDETALRESLHLGGSRIEWLLRQIYREARSPDFATVHVIESLAEQLAIEIVRRFDPRRDVTESRKGGMAAWRMRLVRERIQSGKAPPGTAELAELCDMPISRFCQAFRAETGQSIEQYVRAAAIARASMLLSDGVLVRDVAQALGYSTPERFASAFRRVTGLLPRDMKKQRREPPPIP